MTAIREQDMHIPLSEYLKHQGYTVNSEVRNCDLVARKKDDIIIIELKTRITVSLLVQAAARKELNDAVYIAVPIPSGKNSLPNMKGIRKLLRRMEIGLICVRFLKTKTRIEVEEHPIPFTPRRRHKKREAILREIDGRYAEFNTSGSPTSSGRITAYRQEALRIAHYLYNTTASSPKMLRNLGCNDKTQQILSDNVYGWFERISRGTYKLSSEGETALSTYSYIIEKIPNPPMELT